MKVCQVKIKNLLGLQELEFEPGKVTVIEGENGVGKTSVLEALKAALSGGSDATLLRKGTEKGEVVLVLDDGVEIRKVVTAAKSDLTVTHPAFGKISKPQTYLSKIADALSVNPVEFLTASPKERLAVLLEAIPMRVTEAQLSEALPETARSLVSGIDTEGHGLSVINAISKELFSTRTGVNRAAKEKRATIATMSETLPPEAESGKDWGEVFESLKSEYMDLQKTTQVQVEKIKSEAGSVFQELADQERKAISGHESKLNQKLAELNTKAMETIEAIRKKLADDIRAEEEAADSAIDTVKAKMEEKRNEIRERREELLAQAQADYNPKNEALTAKLTQAQEMMKAEERSKEARRFIEQLQTEAAKLEETSEQLTAGLKALEDLKGSLLSSIPIEGLEIVEGEIVIGGIPFDRVNTAKQVQLAIEVAKLRAGKLGLVAVDNLEHLDRRTFQAFTKAAKTSGLQFVVSRVSEGPLTIGEAEVA